MSDISRAAAGGSVIGLLAAGMLALPSLLPPALAHEEPARTLLSSQQELFPPAFDTANLVKYDYSIEPGVVTDIVKTRQVRKIGFGRTEFVDIFTTPSGTYSTDGLASPNVRYPGIHKELRPVAGGAIAEWSEAGWRLHSPVDAGSFVSITAFTGGQLLLSNEANCVFVGAAAYC